MKKVYNSIEIELQKAEDVIITSGEYLETDRTHIGINSTDSTGFNFGGSNSDSMIINSSVSGAYEI